jgi:hypothetical protein
VKKLPKSDLSIYNRILSTRIELLAANESQAKQIEIAFLICKRPWEIASNLFIQKNWSSRYGVSVSKTEKNLYEPYLNLISNMYELIKEVDAIYRYRNTDTKNNLISHSNPIAWIARCLVDFKALNFHTMTLKELPKIYNNTKQAFVEIEKERLRQFKMGINPFEEQYLGMHHLIEASLELITTYDQFKNKYWKPFLKSYTQLLKFLGSSNIAIAKVETTRITIQKGRGRPPKMF